jgi:phosphoserine phosphatase RsbU/P
MKSTLNVLSMATDLCKQIEQAADGMELTHNAALKGYDGFVVCDLESYSSYQDELAQLHPQQLYVISDASDEFNINLINRHRLHHLVGKNDGVLGPELIGHIRRASSQNMWGLEAYLDPGADIRIISLSDSVNTNEMIAEALKAFNFDEYFSSPSEYLQVMANELISNSLYKGPNQKRQDAGLDAPDRKKPVFLKGSDLVQVTLGMDTRGVALSVQDSFGGLTYDMLTASLIRSFSEKTYMDKKDGAGLGLYLTFLHSNQFIINSRKGFRTEVICVIEKNRRYKNYKQRIRSFHFCEEVKP